MRVEEKFLKIEIKLCRTIFLSQYSTAARAMPNAHYLYFSKFLLFYLAMLSLVFDVFYKWQKWILTHIFIFHFYFVLLYAGTVFVLVGFGWSLGKKIVVFVINLFLHLLPLRILFNCSILYVFSRLSLVTSSDLFSGGLVFFQNFFFLSYDVDNMFLFLDIADYCYHLFFILINR